MYDITNFYRALQDARRRSGLTQRELAERIGTSQPAVASLERGDGNPTIDTLARYARAAGVVLRLALEPPTTPPDRVVERYKQDVDRTLLRQNLRTSVDERLRTLGEWQLATRELQAATARARHGQKSSPARVR